jgi:hypothetical protein
LTSRIEINRDAGVPERGKAVGHDGPSRFHIRPLRARGDETEPQRFPAPRGRCVRPTRTAAARQPAR